MKRGFMFLAMAMMVSAAHAFEIPEMGATPTEAAVRGAIQSYAKQNKVDSEQTSCQGSVFKMTRINSQEGEALVLLSNCIGLRDGEGLMYKVSFKLNLTVPGGVYIVEKAAPYSAPSEALTTKK
jgi:hypothetical protein